MVSARARMRECSNVKPAYELSFLKEQVWIRENRTGGPVFTVPRLTGRQTNSVLRTYRTKGT